MTKLFFQVFQLTFKWKTSTYTEQADLAERKLSYFSVLKYILRVSETINAIQEEFGDNFEFWLNHCV